ncbi:MAG: hypothetical protein LBU73_09250 [Helicobacteraceae bacterium]|jgi:hypothetical protein|nr:hypothetical protein [Helicobacteraceae bacterium]
MFRKFWFGVALFTAFSFALFSFGFFAPSPLAMLLPPENTADAAETTQTTPLAAIQIPADLNKTSETNKTDESNELNETNATDATYPPPKEPLSPPDSLKILADMSFYFASGELTRADCEDGQVCAKNGELRGVDLAQFYCRADAFARGRDMPRFAPNPKQPYDRLVFTLSRRPDALESIRLKASRFLLEGSMFADQNVLRGELTLYADGEFPRPPCNINEGWRSVRLPLNCQVQRKAAAMECSLNYKKLIEDISGVAAKATPGERRELEELRDNLQERFKKRKLDRSYIKEYDLRDMF